MPRREDGSICYSDTHYRDTWAAMESLVDKGLVKAIGLSNFNARQTDDIISMARHIPVVNQVNVASSEPKIKAYTQVLVDTVNSNLELGLKNCLILCHRWNAILICLKQIFCLTVGQHNCSDKLSKPYLHSFRSV